MPQNQAKGLMAQPPKAAAPKKAAAPAVRVSPGVYRNADGSLTNSATPKAPTNNAANPNKANNGVPKQKYSNANQVENRLINQEMGQERDINDIAQGVMPTIKDSLSNPVDYSGLPEAPTWQNFDALKQQQTDATYNDYLKRMEPGFKQEDQDFEQQMYNRGIPLNSELYNNQKASMMKNREDAKRSALTQAMAVAGQNASQFYDVSNQTHQGALSEMMQKRYQPMQEYGMLQGLNQGYGKAAYDTANQLDAARAMPRGGGGGGGSSPAWAQMGFSSPMEYANYQREQSRSDQMWAWQNNPQYKQQQQVNPWYSVGGTILQGLMPAVSNWATGQLTGS